MKLIYMEQTLQLIAKTQGVKVAIAIEKKGKINYKAYPPYLVIKEK